MAFPSRRAALIGLAAIGLVASAVLWVRLGQSARAVIDLESALPQAEKRTAAPEGEQGFTVEAVTIAGVRKRAILAKPPSRITWAVTVPDAAMLEAAYGLREDAWDKPGADGAQFRVAIAGPGGYEELLRQYVNPGAVKSDRKWQAVSLDLSRFAGASVRVIFSTDPGLPPGANTVYDLCVWGEPRIVGGR